MFTITHRLSHTAYRAAPCAHRSTRAYADTPPTAENRIANIFQTYQKTLQRADPSPEKYFSKKIYPQNLESVFHILSTIQSLWYAEDVRPIYQKHISELPEVVAMLIEDNYSASSHLLFKLFNGYYSCTSKQTWPILAKHVENLDHKDKYGWSLMHWAALHGDLLSVGELLNRGLDPFENGNQDNAISAYDLALLRLDRKMLALMKPDESADQQLSKLTIHFINQVYVRLKAMERLGFSTSSLEDLHYLFDCNLLDLTSLIPQTPLEHTIVKLYRPQLNKYERYQSPMKVAVDKLDIGMMKDLFASGWHDDLDTAFCRSHNQTHPEQMYFWMGSLYGMQETDSHKPFFEATLQEIMANDAGVTESEKQYLQEKLASWGKIKYYSWKESSYY